MLSDNSSKVSKPRKRFPWLQFSLRALLLLMLASGLLFAWVGYRVRQFREQHALIQELVSRFGGVRSVPSEPQWLWKPLVGDKALDVTYVDCRAQEGYPLNDALLSRMRDWKRVEYAAIRHLPGKGEQVTDAGLAIIGRWTALTSLQLIGGNFTDKGIAQLNALPHLRDLWVTDLPIGDDGVRQLSHLSELEQLQLSHTLVGDDSASRICGLTKLKVLNLSHTHVTDHGLAALASLVNLQDLKLRGTQITDAGLSHVKSLKMLSTLDISECPAITALGLRQLAETSSLRRIWLQKSQVTTEDVEVAFEHAPNVVLAAYSMLDSAPVVLSDRAEYERRQALQELENNAKRSQRRQRMSPSTNHGGAPSGPYGTSPFVRRTRDR